MEREAIKNSSVIKSIGYDAASRRLEIEFKESGDIYQYLLVPESVFTALMAAKSRGIFFTAKIRGKYEEVLIYTNRVIAPKRATKKKNTKSKPNPPGIHGQPRGPKGSKRRPR